MDKCEGGGESIQELRNLRSQSDADGDTGPAIDFKGGTSESYQARYEKG